MDLKQVLKENKYGIISIVVGIIGIMGIISSFLYLLTIIIIEEYSIFVYGLLVIILFPCITIILTRKQQKIKKTPIVNIAYIISAILILIVLTYVMIYAIFLFANFANFANYGYSNNPTDTAQYTIHEMLNAPGTPLLTDLVQFSENRPLLDPATITRELAISEDQLCMSLGDYKGEDKFSIRDDGLIEYLDRERFEVYLAVACDDAENIVQTIQKKCPLCTEFYCGDETPMPEEGTVCTIGLVKKKWRE